MIVWTAMLAYGGATINRFGVRVIKVIWNNKKQKFMFYIVDTQGQVLLGLRTLRQMGTFNKHPMVYIKTVDLCSSQLREEESGQTQIK